MTRFFGHSVCLIYIALKVQLEGKELGKEEVSSLLKEFITNLLNRNNASLLKKREMELFFCHLSICLSWYLFYASYIIEIHNLVNKMLSSVLLFNSLCYHKIELYSMSLSKKSCPFCIATIYKWLRIIGHKVSFKDFKLSSMSLLIEERYTFF